MFGEDQRRTTVSAFSDTFSRTLLSAALSIFAFYRFQTDIAAMIVGAVVLLVVIADEVKSYSNLKFGEQYRSLWHGELTMRIAIENVLKAVRDGSEIDAMALFREASKKAAEDVKSADAEYEELRSWGLAGKHSPLTSIVLGLIGIVAFYGACSALGIFLRGIIKI